MKRIQHSAVVVLILACQALAEDTTVHVLAWRSVRTHGTCGDLFIALNPTATGNNAVATNSTSGPNVETRGTTSSGGVGIIRIQVDFSGPATTPDASQISVTGYTTTYPGGTPTLGPPVSYPPASATMVGTTTMEMTFSPPLPDQSCYQITLGATAVAEGVDQTVDHDVMVRGLNADANLTGKVTNADVLLIKAKFLVTPPSGASATGTTTPTLVPNVVCDFNLDCVINNSDLLYAHHLFGGGMYTRSALCP